MKKGICKLCLQNKDLCKKSHIIPRFLYKFLIGDDNEIIYIDQKRIGLKRNGGEWEGNILCESCDTKIIGKLDDYAAKFLHGELPNPVKPNIDKLDGRDIVVRENDPNYDYRQFKLFLLSVLWRSSISSRPFFKKLKLRSETEEDLRLRILNAQPGDPEEYPCFIHLPPLVTMPDGSRGFVTIYMSTMDPVYIQGKGLEICKFLIEGMSYYFIISRPQNMNVEPSVDRDKLTMAFSTIEEQEELIQTILKIMKKHN